MLHEGLTLPRLLVNPLRPASRGEAFGAGRPVLVIPGLATGDLSTVLLRRTLRQRGFCPEGWRLGVNSGASPAKLQRLANRIAQWRAESGHKIILVGWSLGGLYARVLAHRVADDLAMVITVAKRKFFRTMNLQLTLRKHRKNSVSECGLF